MADVTITTDTVELFSHDVYFKLYVEDTTAEDYEALLMDMGKLKYEFDIPNSGTDATAVGVKPGTIDITVSDFTTATDNSIIAILESADDFGTFIGWSGFMYYRLKGGTYGNPIPFEFGKDDVKVSEEDSTVTITLNPYLANVFTIDGLDDTVYEFMIDRSLTIDYYTLDYDPDGDTASTDAVLGGEWIRMALYYGMHGEPGALGTIKTWPPAAGDEPIFKSNVFTQGEVSVDSPSTGTEWFVVEVNKDNISGQGNANNLINGLQMLGIMASLEGAIYGNALGRTFYVVRQNTDNSVELAWDNVINPKREPFVSPQYAEINLTHESETTSETFYNYSRKDDMNISFSQSGLYRATIDTSSTCADTTFDSSIIDEGILNYPKVFGAESTRLTFKYWGIENIYPYSVITFDTDAPTIYQSKNFRIRKAEYNFKLDEVELEVYEI